MQKTGELQRRWDSFRGQDVSLSMVSCYSCNSSVMQLGSSRWPIRHACSGCVILLPFPKRSPSL